MDTISRTIRGGHEECFDYNCTPCEDGDKIVEAQHYCVKCRQFYCDVCLKTHRKFPTLKNHKVLGRPEKSEWGTRKAEDECPSHEGQVISMYCGNHDALCCPVCRSLDHKPSCDMEYLPQKAKGIMKNKEYLDVKENIGRMQTDLLRLREDRESLKSNLQRSRQTAVETMTDFKQRLNEALEKLETQFISELDSQHSGFDADILSDIDAIEIMSKELNRLKQDLDVKDFANESQIFIRMKRSQQQFTVKTNEIKALSQMKRVCEVNFTPDLALSELLDRAQSLGKVVFQDYRPNFKYTVDKSLLCNVRAKEEKQKCDITGICQLADGTMVLADHGNDSLKRLGASYQVVDSCKLSFKPTALCTVGRKEVAMTTASKTVVFVSIEDRMSVTRSIAFEHETYGIGYSSDKLYVTDMFSKLYVYTVTGSLIQSVFSEAPGDSMFSNSRNIAVSMYGRKLFVADKNKGLITLENQENNLSSPKHLDVKGAWGVCTDPSGNVFVTTSDNGAVVQVSASGDSVLGVVANKAKGIERPWCVTFDKLQGKLLISKNPLTQGCDFVCVLKLK